MPSLWNLSHNVYSSTDPLKQKEGHLFMKNYHDGERLVEPEYDKLSFCPRP